MTKSHYGCTVYFENEEDIFKFYKSNSNYIVSMIVSQMSPNMASFKLFSGSMLYIKEKYKDRLKVTNGNSYYFA